MYIFLNFIFEYICTCKNKQFKMEAIVIFVLVILGLFVLWMTYEYCNRDTGEEYTHNPSSWLTTQKKIIAPDSDL